MREVSLGVGICTFNRPREVCETVARLLAAAPEAALARIVVVNQGEALGAAFDTVRQAGRDRVQLIAQSNFGGAGGFARSALELGRDPSLTHFVFMDDDIEIDARCLPTATAFLRHARRSLVLGGQMLDLTERSMMRLSGVQVSPDNVLQANHADLDLTKTADLNRLAQAAPTLFTGWWLSIMPAAAVRQAGLPMPVFIRGDDQEFGTRLAKAGVPSVSPPPVSVWHKPVHADPPDWRLYYDLRNRLIFASVHADRFALDSPQRLANITAAKLAVYDYHYTAVIQLALEDYLKGPALLDETPEQALARVKARLHAYGDLSVKRPAGAPREQRGAVLAQKWARVRLLGSVLGAFIGLPHLRPTEPLIDGEDTLHLARLGRRYVLAGRGGHYHLRRCYGWRRTLGRALSTFATIGRYGLQRRRAATAWRAAHAELVTPETWRRRLGLPEETATSGKSQDGEAHADRPL